MNKFYFIIPILSGLFAIVGLNTIANAQAPSWLWANSSGGTGTGFGNSVATDAGGNVLVTGEFYSSSITFGTTVLTNVGNGDMYIVKYDGAGNVLWANSAGGTGLVAGRSISTDAGGNVLVTGEFNNPNITFGTTVLTNNNMNGYQDIFIVKYDAAGNVLWANSAGGNLDDYVREVATDAAGNVLVTGGFNSFSLTFGTTVLANAGSFDMFIVKYDTAGNVFWAHSEGGIYSEFSEGVAADAAGNVLVTGFFESPSITFGITVLTNAGSGVSPDLFVVKYDGAGNVLWANSAGGTGDDAGRSIATDATGNVLVTGFFISPSITFGTTPLTTTGGFDIFIVKYAPAGNVLWANSAGGTEDDRGRGVATDAGGNVLVTGEFYSPSITFGTTVLTNAIAGDYDMFIAKLDNITGIAEENYSVETINIFPNPFSGSTTISFSLPQSQKVSFRIVDMSGRLVTILADKIFETGENEIIWNAKRVNSGIYFLRMETVNFSAIRKLIVEN